MKVVHMPDQLPTSSHSAAQEHLQQQLSLEDWVGWSRVEEILSVAQPTSKAKAQGQQQQTEGSSETDETGSDQQQHQRGQDPSASDTHGSVNVDGVWEVGPQDLDRWRKVRDTD